jgi:asparagine synthase (glutamine-hydrolysing)
MCGIAGFMDFKRQSSRQMLEQCTEALHHRGPDGFGYEFFERDACQVGLGHRRLSIIDLSETGKQPMWYKQWCITFNGEMYNYEEVKKQLQARGHQFIGHSDTEVILHAWEEWGVDMIHRFIGMFAFVIYNSESGELIAFRDRAGVKPFYYYWLDGLFLFASELKSFHQHPRFRKAINVGAVHQFMQHGYILAPQTIFQHTYKLRPGHFLILSPAQPEPATDVYWDVYDAYNKPKLKISDQEAQDEVRTILTSACNYRMVADVPVGVFLSGGYDSSAVTAILQHNRTEKLNTFTIGFKEDAFNEAPYAKQVAEHLGTNHTEYYCTTKEAQDILPTIPHFCDEPFGDSSIIPTTLVSQLARKSVTVALSADAGDETFAGYTKYPLALELLQKFNRVPGGLRGTAAWMIDIVPDELLVRLSGSSAAPIKRERFVQLLRAGVPTACTIMDVMLSQTYSNQTLAKLFRQPIIPPSSYFGSEQLLNQSMHELDKMLAMDYKTYMVDDILVKVDRAAMSTSLEGREPLLDHRIIEFAAQLPPHLKMRGSRTKHILREITHEYLPASLMERKKMGFGVPVFDWLRNELRHYVNDFMQPAHFEAHGLFQPSEVKHIIDRFLAGDRNYNNLFWYLLMFQMWHHKWMD